MLVLLDTGILLRLLDRAGPQHTGIRQALRTLRARGDDLVTSPQNVAEFWNVCTRPATARGGFGLAVQETDRRLRLLERLFRVLPDSPVTYPPRFGVSWWCSTAFKACRSTTPAW